MNYGEKCADVLREAVATALDGAKKPALFLSGGLDSAVIQAIAGLNNLYCCTWPDEDNLTAATKAAQGHPVTPVTFTRDQMIKAIPEVKRLTNGTGTWSQCCQWFMAAKAAEDGCDVVLTGESADELFGGYARYRILYWLDRMYADPHLEAYRGIIDYVLGKREDLVTRMVNRCGKMIERIELVDKGSTSLVSLAADCDLMAGLPQLLINETATIEAHGTEARYPFEDQRVKNFALDLPPKELVTEQETKHCLRDAARVLGVHDDIVNEKTKKGLYIPQSWRPDGEPKWSRGWFEKLMEEASV